MWEFYEKDGAIVALLADRNGGRYSKLGTGNYGGKRVKGEMVSEEWLDPGVRQAKLEQQTRIPPPTTYSYDSDNESVCSNIIDGLEGFSI